MNPNPATTGPGPDDPPADAESAGTARGPRRRSRAATYTRRALIGLLAAVPAVGVGAYLARDQLASAAIRQRLTSTEPDPTFLADDGHVRVLLAGTGSPELSEAAQACTLVAAAGRLFVFDVGEGAARSLNASKVDIARIDHVFITHFHSDHFNGLGALVNQRWTWGASTPLEVTGPPGVADVMAGLTAAYQLDIGYRRTDIAVQAAGAAAATANATTFAIADGETSTRVYEEGGVTIDAVAVDHDPVRPACGYVLRFNGKKVFISGDTTVTELTLPAMQDADLVVHEAYATHMIEQAVPIMQELGEDFDAEVARSTGHYHADTLELASQAQRAGVRHLALTHLIPYPDNAIARGMFVTGMDAEFRGVITLAEDGTLITL